MPTCGPGPQNGEDANEELLTVTLKMVVYFLILWKRMEQNKVQIIIVVSFNFEYNLAEILLH